MKRYGVYGASGFGREIMPLLRQQLTNSESGPWDLVFLDDGLAGADLNGHRVLRYDDWLAEPAEARCVAIGIANSRVREQLADRCTSDGVGYVDVRATNVVVLDAAAIGPGAVMAPFVTITSNVTIGRHFHANIYSYVAHDCVIGDYVTFAPSVHCNGNVTVEDHAYIGTSAILRQGRPGQPLVIGQGAVVGMGAVVTRSVPPGVTVVGNPARPMADRT
jgi:sugar O-acyltransferase (sialic acid O-acetyltransferase NeuD family)